jgi:hypothetical protein
MIFIHALPSDLARLLHDHHISVSYDSESYYVIHLVCYSQSETQRKWMEFIFPPGLSKMIFDKEKDFIDFISHLKIPTQIILDLETFTYDLQTFLMKNTFHHTICFQAQYTYHKCIEALRYGALLVNHAQLSSLQWWWSRTTILSSKMKIDQFPSKGIFAALSPLDLKTEKSWSQILEDYCAEKSKTCASIEAKPYSADLRLFESLLKDTPHLSMIIMENIDKIFPNKLRAMLSFLHEWSNEHNLQIIFNAQSSQVLFESLLDWSTIDHQKGIYRLQFHRGRTTTRVPIGTSSSLSGYPVSLEYVRYTWMYGKNVS